MFDVRDERVTVVDDHIVRIGISMKDAAMIFVEKNIQYLGVAGIAVLLENTTIIIDPYIDIDCTAMEKIARHRIGSLNEIHIYISHGHYDHYEFLPSIIDNLGNKFKVKVFLPDDIYERDKDVLRLQKAVLCSTADYCEKMECPDYHVDVYKGEHYNLGLAFKLSAFLKIRNYKELKKHFSYTAKDMINFVFTIKDGGITVGHIGSPCLNDVVLTRFSKLDILCLAMAPDMEYNIKQIKMLRPDILVPVHHLNRINGIRLLDDYDISVIRKEIGESFYEKDRLIVNRV